MGPKDTKLTIAEALVALSLEKPLEKISVSDIVSKVDINRKTFYYHFADKSKLITWLFRHDMGAALEEYVEAEDLVFTHTGDACDAFPYYLFIKEGVRSLDGFPFVQALARTFEGRRAFYIQALADNSPTSLPTY